MRRKSSMPCCILVVLNETTNLVVATDHCRSSVRILKIHLCLAADRGGRVEWLVSLVCLEASLAVWLRCCACKARWHPLGRCHDPTSVMHCEGSYEQGFAPDSLAHEPAYECRADIRIRSYSVDTNLINLKHRFNRVGGL
jgi:hypothetical protein